MRITKKVHKSQDTLLITVKKSVDRQGKQTKCMDTTNIIKHKYIGEETW